MSKFLNPYTDFGFKKLFGEEENKDLLIDFLNQLLPEHHQIQYLDFRNTEIMGDFVEERKAIFDVFCMSATGERFIVEMQKAKTHFFKDRSLFYVTFPIREQSQKGLWNFKLTPIYFIAVLDFVYDEAEDKRKFRRDVVLKDQDGDVFFDKLNFKFLQMPLFHKKETELLTKFDKWCYFLKHLEDMDNIPAILNEPIFKKAFETAELAGMTENERNFYEESLMSYRDMQNALDTAVDDAIKERDIQIAENLILEGLGDSIVAKCIGLSIAQVIEIRKKINKNL